MARMINGNAFLLQVGKENSYAGRDTEYTRQVRYADGDFNPTYNKVDEGLRTGSKGAGLKETMSLKTEGTIQTLARPDDLGLFLKCALGSELEVEASEDKWKHTFVAIGNRLEDSLPSMRLAIYKVADTFGYDGVKIDSMTLSASPEDYLKLDLTLVGKDEHKDETMNDDLTPSMQSAFKFRHGKVYVDDTEIADVTSMSVQYQNQLDSSTQTTGTGLYFKEYEAGQRLITSEIEMLYTKDTEALREKLYKTDATAKLELVFSSDDDCKLTITVPCNQVSASQVTAGVTDTAKQTATFDAVDNGADELITFELINEVEDEY